MDDEETIKTFFDNIATTTEENENLHQAKLMVATESICLSFKILQSSKLKFICNFRSSSGDCG